MPIMFNSFLNAAGLPLSEVRRRERVDFGAVGRITSGRDTVAMLPS
jgi:hypothetical protein